MRSILIRFNKTPTMLNKKEKKIEKEKIIFVDAHIKIILK